jgi:proliferating cell nuclear antigen
VAIDPANVALVSFKLPSGNFSQFEADEEVIGLNLDSLKAVLRRCSPSSSLIMQSKDNLLKVEIQDKIKRSFLLSTIEIEGEEKAMPNLEFVSKVELNSGDFVDVIEDCIIVADSCSFILKEGKYAIEAKGLNSATAEFSSDEAKISGIDARSKYSLEYLQKFAKASKLSDKVQIQFANDYPLRLDFKTQHAEPIELSFILAPRVETED